MKTAILRLLAGVAASASSAVLAAAALPQLNIDPAQITVSGLSSGGFMANQLGIAHSSTFKGVGVFAAGPYMCAGHASYTACMYNASLSASALSTMQADIDNWSGSLIDAKAGIAAQKVFLFVGNSDYTVGPNPVLALQAQYQNNGVPAASLQLVRRAGTAHVFPTDFDASGNNACSSSASPYIANCGYDGAKAVLSMFYGTLNPRNDAPPASNYIEFDQSAFTTNPGVAANGWVYVPGDCAAGASCRLHVALHGCQQSHATIGDRFLKNTGYTRWADTNRIVVLFPQARVDNTARATAASGSLANPNGCWDWIGWYGSHFAQRGGTQVAAIKAMVERLASGSNGGGGGGGGGTALPAPAGVGTSGATDSSMVIAWSAVNAASGYHVYRNGARVSTAAVAGTRFTDSGLAPATSYSWTVRALDADGIEGAASAPASGTTTGAAAVCFTASNHAHVSAGRATQRLGIAYANGSGQNMGLWNVFVVTTLKQTGANRFVIGSCP